MAWTSMHFAVGMCGGAVLTLAPCLILRRGWRFVPVGMTLGGLWGLVPDMPRLWREDFTSLPFASTLGDKNFEVWLHSIGDLFFLHRSLDSQPKEFALLGLAMIIGLYNLCLIGFVWQHRRAARRPLVNAPTLPNVNDYEAQNGCQQRHAHLQPLPEVDHQDPVVGRISGDKSA